MLTNSVLDPELSRLGFERRSLRSSSPDKMKIAKYQSVLEQRELLEATKPNPTILLNAVKKEMQNKVYTPDPKFVNLPANKDNSQRVVLATVKFSSRIWLNGPRKHSTKFMIKC